MPDTALFALYRALPSMTVLLDAFAHPSRLDAPDLAALCAAAGETLPRAFLCECIEEYLDLCRAGIRDKSITDASEFALPALLPVLIRFVHAKARPRFRAVINATGVVLHTNLGRSPLAEEAVRAVQETAGRYANLEFDLATGERGSRYSHVEGMIRRLTGAEAALVVNNNAAAVLLVLDTLCSGREVVVSRGELVEIGGSFRIPEIMEKSGCILKEVGATNRTHARDYIAAFNEKTAALLKVHTSNFRIIGFTSQVERGELASLAHARDIPLIEDLGSGSLFDFAAAGLPHLATEPDARKILESGVDVVTFSGDKLLGGPQAGVIAGKAGYIERIKKNPLNRALRIDKMTLAALEATLRLHLDPGAARERIPCLRMICQTPEILRGRAQALEDAIREQLARDGYMDADCSVSLYNGVSRTGGGAFPERDLPTWLVRVSSGRYSPDALKNALLHQDPPLVARVENDALCLDPRTLADTEFSQAALALALALRPG